MSENKPPLTPRLKFSLLHLLTLTALIAISTAIIMATRKHRGLVQYRDDLRSLSSRRYDVGSNKLYAAEMTRLADSFHSWHVSVPQGQEFELRLGIGEVSQSVLPPVVGTVPIPAGQHRVTLYAGDSSDEKFQYVVYLDGQPVIEKTMGSDWIPGGWSQASGLDWDRESLPDSESLSLSAKSYTSKTNLGAQLYFHGQSDQYVTRRGYRLWIDNRERGTEPASPFMGFSDRAKHYGIGFRDGIRYQLTSSRPYPWYFTRPKSETIEPVWTINAEFDFDDGTSLSDQTNSFQSWQLRDDAVSDKPLDWKHDPSRSVYTAFLQARHRTNDPRQPVIEMMWDASRPDEVALRLADTPANDRILRWRLRIIGGTQHLWRELLIDNRMIKANEIALSQANPILNTTIPLELPETEKGTIHLQWQTNETLPLQVLAQQQKAYAGMMVYRGLPLKFGAKISAPLKPKCDVTIVAEDPQHPGQAFSSGAVFGELQFDLDATSHDWIWLKND